MALLTDKEREACTIVAALIIISDEARELQSNGLGGEYSLHGILKEKDILVEFIDSLLKMSAAGTSEIFPITRE
jgi:hypothetical protein